MNRLPSAETYVYESVEVLSTGRVAHKTVKLTSRQYVDTLIEIQPVDKTGPNWKKWVNQADLYLINSGVNS
jgi:hypothetical protein